MSTIASANIRFSGLKANYVSAVANVGAEDATGHDDLVDGKSGTSRPPASAISLSFFREAVLDGGEDPIPSDPNTLSIKDHFRGKTFGGSGGDDY